MSEAKRVKGWAVKSDFGEPYLCVGQPEQWTRRRRDAMYPSRDAAVSAIGRSVYRGQAKHLRIRIVRIVAKPKAPKPDKLEQAIVMVKERASGHRCDEIKRSNACDWEGAAKARFAHSECEVVAILLGDLK